MGRRKDRMKRSPMWYYSVILVTIGVMACLYDFITGVDAEASFWGAVMFAPIPIWLFVASKKG